MSKVIAYETLKEPVDVRIQYGLLEGPVMYLFPFGRTVEHLLQRRNMTIERLATKAGIRRQTLSDAMAGKSNPRPSTLKWIYEALGVTAEEFLDLQEALEGEGDTETKPTANSDADILSAIRDALDRIDGLPLYVARSIVREYDLQVGALSAGEIEEILRRKAREYITLKDQIQKLQPLDPRVKRLQMTAMDCLDRGDFGTAKSHLIEARKIDRSAWMELDARANSRRRSEVDTIRSQAQLCSLHFDYGGAAELSKEALSITAGRIPDLLDDISTDLARFLNLFANEKGGGDVIESAISDFYESLLPSASSLALEAQLEVMYRLADIHSVNGYRLACNNQLVLATRIFRENACAAFDAKLDRQYGSNLIRLGDCHSELGLNRASAMQLKLGLSIMERAINLEVEWEDDADHGRSLIKFGTSLANAGLFLSDAELFGQAETAYNAAARVFADKDEVNHGRALWGLGIANVGLGELQSTMSYFDAADEALELALEKITEDRFPIDHATIIQNRGNAKLKRGLLENGLASLKAAIIDYDIALTVRTDDRFKLGKLKTIGNRARAKGILASRTADLQLVCEAIDELEVELSGVSDGYWKTYYHEELVALREIRLYLSDD